VVVEAAVVADGDAPVVEAAEIAVAVVDVLPAVVPVEAVAVATGVPAVAVIVTVRASAVHRVPRLSALRRKGLPVAQGLIRFFVTVVSFGSPS